MAITPLRLVAKTRTQRCKMSRLLLSSSDRASLIRFLAFRAISLRRLSSTSRSIELPPDTKSPPPLSPSTPQSTGSQSTPPPPPPNADLKHSPAIAASAVATSAATSSSLPSAAAKDMGWNDEFQYLYEMVCTTPLDATERARRLEKCVAQFVAAATPIAQQIVRELALPNSAKTIPPVAGVGGVAGGVKYLHSNIFYKYFVSHSLS
jgi:hypothetical protein